MESRPPISSSDRDRIEEDAARLIVDFGVSPETDDGRAAVAAWLAQGPLHAVSYARARAAWRDTERLKAAPPRIEPEAVAGPAGHVEALFMRRRVAAVLLLFSGLATAAIVGVQVMTSVDRYHTGVGERQTVLLPDGSTMQLNTASAAEVSMRGGTRQVHLLGGEAMFDIAVDAARPFVVDASSAELRADGSTFNVRMRPDQVELATISGRVLVRDGRQGTARLVPAGKLAAIRRGVVAESDLDPAALAQRTAWRSNTIDLDGATLAQAIEEFNRYRSTPLVIGDPRIAALRVGGRFGTTDSRVFVAALSHRFAIRAIEGTDRSLVLVPNE